ncbi:MAG: hypothetical protein LC808_05625 [Actinobacteria bacterium]|nr:hypothetical protein [Actinomycetota bacterium]
MIQAHANPGDLRQPSPAELHELFNRWRATKMESYLVFSWRWPPDKPDLWLANNAELQEQLQTENSR